MFREWRRRRAITKVKPGDGRPLKPFRWWHSLTRTRFHTVLPDDDGEPEAWAVDLSYLDAEEKIDLYREGRRVARASSPAVFPVPGGAIEVTMSTFGLSRCHVVPDDGEPRQLVPDRLSSEGLRARFGRRFPRASRVMEVTAVVVLIVGLVVAVPQALEWLTSLELAEGRLEPFTSPIQLPGWASTTLLVAGLLAAFERALTLRNHWLIDADTWFIG